MPLVLIPLGGVATSPATPPVETVAPPPIPNSVIVGAIETPCQVNFVFPCLEKQPKPAVWMVCMAECDCWQVDPEDRVKAACDECKHEWLDEILKAPDITCECGTVYRPGMKRVHEVVRIR